MSFDNAKDVGRKEEEYLVQVEAAKAIYPGRRSVRVWVMDMDIYGYVDIWEGSIDRHSRAFWYSYNSSHGNHEFNQSLYRLWLIENTILSQRHNGL